MGSESSEGFQNVDLVQKTSKTLSNLHARIPG